MKWPVCLYTSAQAGSPCYNLGIVVQRLHDQVAQVLDGKIDGYNIKADLFNPDVFSWSTQTQTAAKVITIPALDPDEASYVRRKGETGVEFVVDAGDSTAGSVCVVDKDYLDEQLITLRPEDPATETNPGGLVRTPRGKLTFDTGGAFDVVGKRNGAEYLRLDGTGILASKAQRFAAGLAAPHLTGPGDVAFAIDTGGAVDLVLKRNATEEVVLDGTNLTIRQNLKQRFATEFSGTFACTPTADRTWTLPDANATLSGFGSGGGTLNRLLKWSATPGVTADADVEEDGTYLSTGRIFKAFTFADPTSPTKRMTLDLSDVTLGETRVLKVPDLVAQTILTRPSTTGLTPSYLLRWEAGGAVDSGVHDDGSTIWLHRAVQFPSDLGAIAHLTGPEDHDFVLSAGAAERLMLRPDLGNSGEFVFSSAMMMALGGATSAFPALKRSGAYLLARLADDSADTDYLAAGYTFSLPAGGKTRFAPADASTASTITVPARDFTIAGTDDIAAHEAAADPHTGYQKESEREVANGYAGLDAAQKVIRNPASATATPGSGKIPIADDAGKLAAGWGGAAYSLATLDNFALVVQNPANASSTPAPNKIPVSNYWGKLEAGWGGDPECLATLDISGKVVENPANATATPTADKIPIADEGASLDAWVKGAANRRTKWCSGLALKWTTTDQVTVGTGACRDDTDAKDLTLSAETIVSPNTPASWPGTSGGDIRSDLAGTVSATGGTTTVTGSGTAFLTAFGVRSLGVTCTFTTGSTTVTGSGFYSGLAIGDAIGVAGGYYQEIAAITSDTSLTLAAGWGGSSTTAAAYVIENPVIRITASAEVRRVTQIRSDTVLVVSGTLTTTVSGSAWTIGNRVASTWYYTWLLSDGTNTILLLSTQRTTPFIGGTYWKRRLPRGAVRYMSDLTICPFTVCGDQVLYADPDGGGGSPADLRVLSGGTATSWTYVGTSAGIPPTADACYCRLIATSGAGPTTAGSLLQPLNVWEQGVSNARALAAAACPPPYGTSTYGYVANAGQGVRYQLTTAGSTSAAYLDIHGYTEATR